ncbi:MAG: hypothetical protein V3V78_02870, partial [Candidatus Woesearchaeota archaeon]
MKDKNTKGKTAFPNLDFIVIADKGSSLASYNRDVSQFQKRVKRAKDVFSGNYENLSYFDLGKTVRELNEELENKDSILNKIAEHDPRILTSIENAEKYLKANMPSFFSKCVGFGKATVAAAGITLLTTATQLLPFMSRQNVYAETEEEKEEPSEPIGLDVEVVAQQNTGSSGDDTSSSSLARTKFKTENVKVDIIHTGEKLGTGKNTAQTGIPDGADLRDEFYDETRDIGNTKSSLSLDFLINRETASKHDDPKPWIKFGIRYLLDERYNDYSDETITHIYGTFTDIWSRTANTDNKDENRFNFGVKAAYVFDLEEASESITEDTLLELGILGKYEKTNILETEIEDVDGLITSTTTKDGEGDGIRSAGITLGLSRENFFARLNAVWHTGNDIPSGEGSERNLYLLWGFDDIDSALNVYFSDKKSNPFTALTFIGGLNKTGETSDDTYEDAFKNIHETFEEMIDYRTFNGEEAFQLENYRFISMISGTGGYAVQYGGNNKKDGYFTVMAGLDSNLTGNSYLDLAIATKQGELDNIWTLMAYYAYKEEEWEL